MVNKKGKEIFKTKLTEKEKLFCKYLVYETNYIQKEAAIKAGYSESCAAKSGSDMMSKPKIKKEVYRLKSRLTDKFKITKEKIVKELASIAFSNIENHVSFDNITVKLHSSDTTDNRAIKEVKQGEKGNISISMYDKHNALKTLLEYLPEEDGKEKDFSVNITVINSNDEVKK